MKQNLKRRRIRRRIYCPNWVENKPFYNWSKGFNTKNYWRVEHYFGSKEDALAEIAYIFSYCRHKTFGQIHSDKHFMKYFMTAVTNRWNNYADADTRIRETFDYSFDDTVTTSDDDEREQTEQYTMPTCALIMAIKELPPDAFQALSKLLEAPSEWIDILFQPSFVPKKVRKVSPALDRMIDDIMINGRLRRVFHLVRTAQDTNIVAQLRELTEMQK